MDNLIQIAHNVIIGENTVIAAQSGVAGSSTIGKNNMLEFDKLEQKLKEDKSKSLEKNYL